MIDLFISDVDGTLLQNNGYLSGYSFKNLQRLLNEGVHFTVASARSVVSMREVLGPLSFKLPIIEFNGAYLSEFSTGKHVMINSIESDMVGDILNRTICKGHAPFLSTFNGIRDNLYYNTILNDGMQSYLNSRQATNDIRLREPVVLKDVLGEQIICFTIIGDLATLTEMRDDLSSSYAEMLSFHIFEDGYNRGWFWLTIHDYKSTKDRAIAFLREYCGFSECTTTVFGDHINDVTMFKDADRAVAVSNAHELLKKHATEVIGSNTDDSVVNYLLEFHTAKDKSVNRKEQY